MKNESPTNSDIYDAMIQHFKDDAVAFGKIDEKFEKNNKIAINNGEHMSHIRLDLSMYNQKIDSLTEIVTNHITAVEPILSTYNDTQATKRTLMRIATPIITFILTTASLIGAYYVIIGITK